MKVYVTKHALTSGVFIFEGVANDAFDLFYSIDSEGYGKFFDNNDWHTTKESALARCEEMRIKKVKSLKKQLGKILNMKFEIKEEA